MAQNFAVWANQRGIIQTLMVIEGDETASAALEVLARLSKTQVRLSSVLAGRFDPRPRLTPHSPRLIAICATEDPVAALRLIKVGCCLFIGMRHSHSCT